MPRSNCCLIMSNIKIYLNSNTLLEYNGFKIVDCKEFRSENFIPENDTITAYQLYGSSISQVEDSVITLSFVCCIPDTDIGYDVSLKFDTQGTYSYKVTDTIDFYSEE